MCACGVGCLQWDRGVGGLSGGRRESGERWRRKRESLRRVRALMAPLTTSSVMVSLSLSLSLSLSPECCEIAGRLSTAEDSEETNGLLIQSAER